MIVSVIKSRNEFIPFLSSNLFHTVNITDLSKPLPSIFHTWSALSPVPCPSKQTWDVGPTLAYCWANSNPTLVANSQYTTRIEGYLKYCSQHRFLNVYTDIEFCNPSSTNMYFILCAKLLSTPTKNIQYQHFKLVIIVIIIQFYIKCVYVHVYIYMYVYLKKMYMYLTPALSWYNVFHHRNLVRQHTAQIQKHTRCVHQASRDVHVIDCVTSFHIDKHTARERHATGDHHFVRSST